MISLFRKLFLGKHVPVKIYKNYKLSRCDFETNQIYFSGKLRQQATNKQHLNLTTSMKNTIIQYHAAHEEYPPIHSTIAFHLYYLENLLQASSTSSPQVAFEMSHYSLELLDLRSKHCNCPIGFSGSSS